VAWPGRGRSVGAGAVFVGDPEDLGVMVTCPCLEEALLAEGRRRRRRGGYSTKKGGGVGARGREIIGAREQERLREGLSGIGRGAWD
jgi:hypothetical protein